MHVALGGDTMHSCMHIIGAFQYDVYHLWEH